jgi:hypothetical protein
MWCRNSWRWRFCERDDRIDGRRRLRFYDRDDRSRDDRSRDDRSRDDRSRDDRRWRFYDRDDRIDGRRSGAGRRRGCV